MTNKTMMVLCLFLSSIKISADSSAVTRIPLFDSSLIISKVYYHENEANIVEDHSFRELSKPLKKSDLINSHAKFIACPSNVHKLVMKYIRGIVTFSGYPNI